MALAWVVATFTGVENSVNVTWALTSNPPKVSTGISVSDGLPAPQIGLTNVTNTGATVNTSAPFTGTVTLIGMD